ncbi:hypothetical protein NCS56_00684000 [Fusarium sp. Ph1]|nr:hypothetical protein NCS56_00684000 [Fusarium sp. Ph1]
MSHVRGSPAQDFFFGGFVPRPRVGGQILILLLPVQTVLSRLLDSTATMISDGDLYRLAIFLGSTSMILIVVYHFLEINAVKEVEAPKKGSSKQAAL